jgi:hypothetical protein
MSVTLDDKILAKEHAIAMLKALRDIDQALHQWHVAPRGRKREAAMTGIFMAAGRAREVLAKTGLRNGEND